MPWLLLSLTGQEEGATVGTWHERALWETAAEGALSCDGGALQGGAGG